MNRLLTLALAVVLLLLGAVMYRNAQAQAAEQSFAALLQTLSATQTEFTVYFVQPLATGERSRTFGADATLNIGVDYFCFSELWNNQDRQHCLPFSNIVSVTAVRG
ncbi:MAG: hypothetical protein H7Y11_14320 [Armatimonadetes bacterium]|nr:hypothetical protein [Anaerolineae bacterium]